MRTPVTRVAQPQPVTERVSLHSGERFHPPWPYNRHRQAPLPRRCPSLRFGNWNLRRNRRGRFGQWGDGRLRLTNGGGGGTAGEVRDVAFGGANGPSFLSRVLPTYPLAARRMGREGKVLLRLTLDERGKLLHVDVLENPGYGFADAAVEAVRKSRFLPAHGGDRPLACRVRLPIRFALQAGD